MMVTQLPDTSQRERMQVYQLYNSHTDPIREDFKKAETQKDQLIINTLERTLGLQLNVPQQVDRNSKEKLSKTFRFR